ARDQTFQRRRRRACGCGASGEGVMSATLWSAAQLAAATGANVAPGIAVSGVSIDSRSLKAGDLFVALKVERDGHDFVANAIGNGAAAALVAREVAGIGAD